MTASGGARSFPPRTAGGVTPAAGVYWSAAGRAARGASGSMEIPARGRGSDDTRPNRKVAEALAVLPVPRVGEEQRPERRHDAVVVEVWAVELVEPRAVEGGP